jgi:hypothetical protein
MGEDALMPRQKAAGRTREHGAVLRRVVRETLEPIGLTTAMGPRYWVDDHGWWLTCLWYEPSDFQQGTYLRAGRMFLWVERANLAVDADVVDRWQVRGRTTAWVAAKDATEWERSVHDLATASVAYVERVRMERHDVHATAERLSRHDGDAWTDLHLGVAHGLDGDVEAARLAFERVGRAANPHDAPWLEALRRRAADLAAVVPDSTAFRSEVTATVVRARRRLRLPERSPEEIDRMLTAPRG